MNKAHRRAIGTTERGSLSRKPVQDRTGSEMPPLEIQNPPPSSFQRFDPPYPGLQPGCFGETSCAKRCRAKCPDSCLQTAGLLSDLSERGSTTGGTDPALMSASPSFSQSEALLGPALEQPSPPLHCNFAGGVLDLRSLRCFLTICRHGFCL